VVVDLHTTIDSKDEAAQRHAASHAKEDVDRADLALLAISQRGSV